MSDQPKPLDEVMQQAYNELDCDDYPILTWVERARDLRHQMVIAKAEKDAAWSEIDVLRRENAAMRKFVERARDDLERSICECGFHLKETDAYDSVMLALGRKAAGG